MKINFLLLCFILLCFSYNSLPCDENDFQQYFSSCNTTTNTRIVSIYLTKNCTSFSNNNTLINIYSKLPTFTIKCGIECPAGTFIFYDVLTQSTICKKCPENTYNYGGNFKIMGEWSESSLEHFQADCYAIDLHGYKKNVDCTGLQITKDKTMMTSGEITGNQIKYYIQVMFFFKAKNYGRMILKYKKDSYKEQTYNNGDFKVVFDYNFIASDNEPNSPWRTISHDFEPGEHEIVFSYWYFRTSSKRDLKFYIQSFEILGIDDTAYQCFKCINSVSPEGSDRCYLCKPNHYFDSQTKTCVECSEGQYIIPSLSTTLNSCLPKNKCSDYDYTITNITECLDGEKFVSYNLIEPLYCLDNENAYSKTKPFKCDSTSYAVNNYKTKFPLLNNEHEIKDKCEEGYYLTNMFVLDLIDEDIDDFWSYNQGWKNNGKELYTGLYIVNPIEMVLTKIFKVKYPEHAHINILFDIDLDKHEIFTIKTHQDILTYSNMTKTNNLITLHLSPLSKQSFLTFIYEKNSNHIKETNAVSIKHIEIYGSDLSNKNVYQRCPKGTISNQSDNCLKCIKCPKDSIPNNKQTECIKCEKGLPYLNSNNEYVCGECPSYTYLSEGNCKLYEVLHQKEKKLKFNLNQMKKWIIHLCNDQSGILCYNNSFIGPINNNILTTSNQQKEILRDLFFLSLFEPKSVLIDDFSYTDTSSQYNEGHIFGLFSIMNIIDNSHNKSISNEETFLNSNNNITYHNTKIKRNLASQIAKVNLLSNKQSILIEYVEGDVCLNDKTKKYKSYLYLKCNKYNISTPKLINIIDNQCTFIFEWESPFLCKNCITQELTNFEVGACKNSLRQFIFNANTDCSIFNASNPMFNGYDKIFNDSLLNENDLNLHNKRLLERTIEEVNQDEMIIVTKNNKNFSFPFEYIESKFYYQECSLKEDLDNKLKKYLIIIPLIYLITVLLVVCYCCKYWKVKKQYEQLKQIDDNKDKGKENEIYIEDMSNNVDVSNKK